MRVTNTTRIEYLRMLSRLLAYFRTSSNTKPLNKPGRATLSDSELAELLFSLLIFIPTHKRTQEENPCDQTQATKYQNHTEN
ncbi:unnamed protein product [Amoebophrya sp. A25]|nr:unnamed protein product [Amoebophrya sp. A25]|eukprot:GSA25T00012831001.1